MLIFRKRNKELLLRIDWPGTLLKHFFASRNALFGQQPYLVRNISNELTADIGTCEKNSAFPDH